jgi:alkylation response protein AidB-like acyl-CoA dehydrogenase
MAMAIQDELTLLEDNVRRFAEREIAPHVEAMEHHPDASLPPQILEGLQGLGLLGLCLPTAAGGDGAGPAALARVLGALAETSAATATLLLTHAFAQRLVARTGDAWALERIAADADGRAPLLAYPIYAEPSEVGRDVGCVEADDSPRVTGRWDLVVNAPIATWLALPVRSVAGGTPALVLLEATAPGVRVSEAVRTLGMHGSPVADVQVRSLALGPHPRIAGDGFEATLRTTHAEMRGAAAAISAGVVRASVRTALAYARERYQGGRQIIDHQEVRRMVGEMMSDADLCAQASRLLSDDGLNEPAATGLFLRARSGAARATCDGVQVLGGNGYMEDYMQERCMRDAKQAQCLLGRNEALHQAMLETFLTEVAP